MTFEWLAGPQHTLTRFGERPRYREGLYRVGRSTYAWMVPNGSWGETNLGLIDCGGKSVLIDTCWDVKFTREALSGAAAILRESPIELVINSHADGDHCWGNQLFADKPIIATHACAKQLVHHPPQKLHTLGAAGKLLGQLHVRGLDKFGHYMHNMFAPYDFAGIRLTAPNQCFSGERTLQVQGLDIVISEVGPAHTDGDCIVYVPDQRVVYTADILFVDATPVMWSGPVENLVAALKRVLGLRADVIVPGHGRLATQHDVQRVLDYWEFVQEQLWPHFQRGMPPTAAARDVIMGGKFQHAGFARWDSPERMVSSAHTLYRGWGKKTNRLLGDLGVLNTLRQQAEVAFALPEATPRRMHAFDGTPRS